jgi:hypothetical protein
MSIIHRHGFLLVLLALTIIGTVAGQASITEDFSSNPVSVNRFEQSTTDTDSSFTYNSSTQDLTAVLDYDFSDAAYTAPFTTATKTSDATFSMSFNVKDYAANSNSHGFFGLFNSMNANDGHPDSSAVAAYFLYNGSQLCVQAKIEPLANTAVYGGNIPLAKNTNYTLTGTYSAANGTLTIKVYDKSKLVGTSTTSALDNWADFSVDRLGLQNCGHSNWRYDDQGSITMTVDNLAYSVPEPMTLSLIFAGIAFAVRRKRA